MKINEELAPYEKDFYSECNKIKFFCSSLKEIKFQIEFLEKICGKELEIYEKESSNLPVLINTFNESIFTLNSEPSNLVSIITDLVTLIDTNFSFMRIGLIECHKIFENNIPQITKTIDALIDDILKKSISILKENAQNLNKENLNKYLNQTFELVVINIFKGLVYINQFFVIYSKAKTDLNLGIKNTVEEKSNNKIIDIIIDDFSERKLAKESLGIHYEPIHFGNHNYDIILGNDSENILSLCDSYFYYGHIFLKCIKIRKKLIFQFKKLIKDIVNQSPNNIIEKILHIRDKIQKTKEGFKILGIGTEKSWELLITSWTYLYNTLNNFFQFYQEIGINDLKDNSMGKKEDYKTFENQWGKLSKKIIELKNKYAKDYTPEKKREIKKNQKEYKEFLEKEKQIKNFLNGECYDFLNANVPIIRETEKKKAIEIQEICYRFKKIMKKSNEENLENSNLELKNSALIDIFQEIKDIFNKQNDKLKIKDLDNYIEQLKEKILKLDFGQDNLSENVKLSLDNYFKISEEMNNSLTNKSYSDNSIDSLKEFQFESEINKKIEDIDNNNNFIINNNNENNNLKINNNDLSSFNSITFHNINSGSLLKMNSPSKDINFSINKNKDNNHKDLSNINLNINLENKNNSNLQSINNEYSFPFIKDSDSNNLEKNLNKNKKINIKISKENETEENINEILNNYYKDPSKKNYLLNRSKDIFTMLNDIHFFDRLNKATKERMILFEKEFKKSLYFRSPEEFDNIFINEKDIKSTLPLTLIFHYIFNPKTIIREYPHWKSFFETIFTMRGDYNLVLLYDKLEIDKIPKYFNDFDYVNNLFNNYNKNDLDLFLKGIETWSKTFKFQLNFVHPIKKLMIGPDRITIRDVAIIYFISPTDLIVDYHTFGSDFPFAETFVSSSQYRFHCDIKFNKNLGRFTFKTSAIVYNKVTLLRAFSLEDILKNEANKNNKTELQINTWEPFRIVIESKNKEHEIEANKIFFKNLKNNIYSYSDKKPEDYEVENIEESSTSENESSSEEKAGKKKNKKLKRKKYNDNLYFGILIILGLLTIKTLFSINNGFFSFDNLLNVLILISICFVLYSSKK